MQRYTVINYPVTLYTGILDLTPEQAAPRKICLVDMGDGFYEITSAVTFKVGEQFGFDGEVNRNQLERLIPAPAATFGAAAQNVKSRKKA